MDHRDGYRHDVRGGLMSFAPPGPPILDASATMALGRLAAARATGRPCRPVRQLLPDGDVSAAYAVQAAWGAPPVAAGGPRGRPQDRPHQPRGAGSARRRPA